MSSSKTVRHTERLPPLPFGGQHTWAARVVQSVRSALTALAAHKGRAAMTTFGIVLGVCGVLVIDVLGQAQHAALAEQLAQLGTNLVSISPGVSSQGGASGGDASAPTLADRDVQLLQQQVPYLRALTPLVSGTETLAFGARTAAATVTGAYPDVAAARSYSIQRGRFFTAADESAHLPVAVIGQTLVEQLFPSRDPLGAEVRIRDVNFRVIGVLRAMGHRGQADLDDVALVPFSTAQERLYGPKVDGILLQAASTARIPAVMAAATAILDQSHRTPSGGQGDFAVRSSQQMINASEQQTALLTRVLTIVAGVALAMGGLGVMSITLISATERTAEIGLRLAVGARPADVMVQFLAEALSLTTVAGVIGLLLGFALPVALRVLIPFLAAYPAMPTIETSLVTFAVVVATGVVSGFYPALRASRLDPVVALRSE